MNDKLTSREVEDCDGCDLESDCCCGIELRFPLTTIANLDMCGTLDGVGSCSFTSGPSPCNSISGGQQPAYLDPTKPKLIFCMQIGDALAVTNLEQSLIAYVILTCQNDVVNPQTLIVTIPAMTTLYFYVSDGCQISQCT